jgi:hypothetical protein
VSLSVGATPAAKRQADTLRGKAAKAYSEALVRLEAEGCAAADYRLTGETIDHICALHLYAEYRMLVCFPDADSVVVVLVARHGRGNRDDVYGSLYSLLGIEETTGRRTKPSCCDRQGGPPVDAELFDRLLVAARRFTRRR